MYQVIHYNDEDKRLYELYHKMFQYDDGLLIRKISTSSQAQKGYVVGKTTDKQGYCKVCIEGKVKKLHRVIYHMFHGHCPSRERPIDGKTQIDHIDRVRHNNRIENLRAVSGDENQRNTHGSITLKGRTSKYKGISKLRDYNKWRVRITVNHVTHHIGYFDSEEEAIDAYNKHVVQYHGEYAVIH